ncbi:MAG: hypothetical protein ACLUPK_06665 [Veillonella sp.]
MATSGDNFRRGSGPGHGGGSGGGNGTGVGTLVMAIGQGQGNGNGNGNGGNGDDHGTVKAAFDTEGFRARVQDNAQMPSMALKRKLQERCDCTK